MVGVASFRRSLPGYMGSRHASRAASRTFRSSVCSRSSCLVRQSFSCNSSVRKVSLLFGTRCTYLTLPRTPVYKLPLSCETNPRLCQLDTRYFPARTSWTLLRVRPRAATRLGRSVDWRTRSSASVARSKKPRGWPMARKRQLPNARCMKYVHDATALVVCLTP